jgi:thiamine pyrophosphate-dependent acetolactate synthase large subunit-like protein
MTGGEAVVETLIANDVEIITGLIGSSTLEILDGLYNNADNVRYIGCIQESAGMHLSDGYARYTGKPGIFIAGQAGPGITNTVTAMAQAKAAFSPVINLAGAIARDHRDMDAFQEVDQVSLMKPVSKKVFEVKDVDTIPLILNEGFETALTPRMGPVHIDLPRDVLGHSSEFAPPQKHQIAKLPIADETSIQKSVKLLSEAEKPVILIGAGIKNYGSEGAETVISLAELLNAPMTASPGHNDVIPSGHPLYAGAAGPRGSGLGSNLLKEADVILVLGSRIGFNTSFYSYENINEKASIIQCEIDQKSIGRYFPVEVGILADAKTVAKQLYSSLKTVQLKKEVEEWSHQFKKNKKSFLDQREASADTQSVPILSSGLFKELRSALPKDAIITLDAGTMCLQLTDALDFHQPKSLFSPLDYGLIGWSYPAGLGLKIAAPDRTIVSFHGDGGFATCYQELATAVENKINTIAIICNNKCWGAEKSYQKDFFDGRFIGADVSTPDFDKVAELYGCQGIKVEKATEIGDAIQAGIKAECPTVIDVQCSPDALYSFRQDSFKHKVTK